MSMNTVYPHLTIDEQGQARVGETRYKVAHLAAEHYQHGWTAEELLRQHPDLRPEEVYAALTFFYDHHDGMVADMKKSCADAEALRPAQQFSRDELLRRKAVQGK
ncbi:MAG: DUF433 domain-containing protein [Planctomycetia bacterium]|nr:DUF433 domain-containing protein [Planctomycetia bacterium]